MQKAMSMSSFSLDGKLKYACFLVDNQANWSKNAKINESWTTPSCKPFEVQGSRSQQSWWISRPCKALRKALGPRSPDVEPVVFALEWISKDLEPAEKAKVKAPPWSSDYQWIWEYVGWVSWVPPWKFVTVERYMSQNADIQQYHAISWTKQSMLCLKLPKCRCLAPKSLKIASARTGANYSTWNLSHHQIDW